VTTFVCFLFEPPPKMHSWARAYSPEWVDKLYRGIKRNTADPYPHFVCFTDKTYRFEEDVLQVQLRDPTAGFGCLAEAWRDDYTERKICVLGLDTIICGNIDTIIDTKCEIGLLRDPYAPTQVGNMVGLYSQKACEMLWRQWNIKPHGMTDQNFLRKYVGIDRCTLLNDKYPGEILSYKVHVKQKEIDREKLKILYFHGNPKPDAVMETEPWLKDYWT